jgi:tetratricopeptide (TPR) repeat protein
MAVNPRRGSVVGPLLQQGLQARKEGRLAAAHAAFADVLKQQPDQPDALRLLADVSEDLGRPAEAEQCLRRATELRPDDAAAQYNRARLLRQLGEPAAAAQCLVQALNCRPQVPTLLAQTLQLQATLQEDAGQLELALATLEQALEGAPQRAALHHNRGVLLQRLARPAEALAAHDEALRLGLVAADAHYNRGNTLQSLGRQAEALDAYRTALARDPQHALALYDIARLRWRLGDAAFTVELDAAAAGAPGSALAHGIKGRLLLRAERYAEAAAAFAQAAALSDQTAGYFDGLGQALSRLGRFDEALGAHRRAVALAPRQAATHISHASSLLQAGQAAQAAQVAELAVRLDPLDQQAWAFLGLAWRASGDAREAWLNDYQSHVQAFDLAPPEAWADATAFNRALAAELEQLHTDAQAPVDQTLRHGSQTEGNIFDQGHPLVTQLRGRIAQAVDRYVAHLQALPRDDGHPLLGRVSARWRFTDSWSSRLRSSGFHTQHVHPHGWISSCYYAALPPSVARGGDPSNPQAGWITFGTPDIAVPGCDIDARRAEQPSVGRLVLFPSFMWHGTVPFADAQARLTLAFDVLPVA